MTAVSVVIAKMAQSQRLTTGLGTWRWGGDVQPDRVAWACAVGCSASLLESLGSLDELGGLARRLGDIGLSGEHGRRRGKCTRTRRSLAPPPASPVRHGD